MPAPVGALNNSVLAALLFIYIFVIQYVPMPYDVRLAAQLLIGVFGVLVGFYFARLTSKLSLLMLLPVLAAYGTLVLTGLDGQYLYFALYGLLVVTIFVLTWRLKR